MKKFTRFRTLLCSSLLFLCSWIFGAYHLIGQPIYSTPNGRPSYNLTWDSSPSASGEVNWTTAGATSQTFNNVDNSGVNITFTFSGDVGTLGDWNGAGGSATPSIGTNASNSGTEVLEYFTDGFNTGSNVTITITFSQAIYAIGYDIYHVNGAGPNGDSYAITASTSTGGTIYPTLSSSASPSYTTNSSGFVDSNNNSTSGDNAIVGINFADADGITSITMVWDDCTACTKGSVHGSAFSNFNFTMESDDADEDGITDENDIDDDNDGILDEIESCGSVGTPTTQDITIEILFDNWATETNWTLKNSSGTTVLSGGPYSSSYNGTTISSTYSNALGDFTFNITDDASDGICCGYGTGHYEIKVGGVTVVGGSGSGIGNFGSSATNNISAGSGGTFSCLSGDPSGDDDNDGTVNYMDADFCTLNGNGVCSSLDSDGDGVIDQHDIDSDNDGIVDNIEAQTTSGYIAPADNDTDGDGLDDAYDTDCSPCGAVTGVSITGIDSDGDGTNDYLDSDSDGDGFADSLEGHDTNGDGTVDGSDSPNANTGLAGGTTDSDGDGLYDGFDNNTSDPDPTNGSLTAESHPDVRGGTTEQDWREEMDSDGDGLLDSEDIDDDNDGILDVDEGYSNITNTGQLNTTFPTGYWSIMYYEGTEAISGSSYGAVSGTGGSGSKVFRGSSYAGVGQATLDYSSSGTGVNDRWSQTETPTDPILPANYQGNSWSSSGNPYYQLEFRRKFQQDGNLTFGYGANEIVDDAIEVFVNGSRVYGHWPSGGGGSPDARPGGGVGVTLALNANDEVEIRFINLGWIGGLTFSFTGPSDTGIDSRDTDKDGIADYLDLDSDNDGIPDIIEAGGIDSDGDGRVDNTTDTDGDGLVDTYDNDDTDGPDVSACTIGTDCDLDGSTSSLLDTDADGINDEDGDFDNDGVANWIDLDADNDGILDIIEAGGTDSNGDGVGDTSTDADLDGYFDIVDTDAADGPGANGSNGNALMSTAADGGDADSRIEYTDRSGVGDSDGDDVPDFLDVDSDNDGIYDIYEAQATVGFIPLSGADGDGDGVDDEYDDDDSNWGGIGALGISPVNTDAASGDSAPDYLDTDTDEDGSTDLLEAWDAINDGDILPDGVSGSCETDSDGDGLVDCFDSNDSDKATWTLAVTPPDDDGTGGSTSSLGIDISLSNDVGGIFPNNAGGDSSTEPDWRDDGISPFPVEWLSFAANQIGVDAELTWSTASELNADTYEIERSVDGNSFEWIGQEQAQGTTSEISEYQFTDKGIDQLQVQTIYYRLRQIDLDGTFSFSSTIELTVSEMKRLWLRPRPNPVADILTIEYQLAGTMTGGLEVVSSLGQKIYRQAVREASGEIRLTVQGLPNGVYFIILSSEEQIEIHKVVVKH